ncbi:hypothetical protein GOBAR_AA31689 [Gossypium barbadense]|uniref:Cytochrome P450 n=1 Tax=Gossypium barbadense TaxID=3634 RepID=A0A2P5WD21_GOSBA|nr:hypothetical protein GOBAR_AA31689 [Gossypium barbadense]
MEVYHVIRDLVSLLVVGLLMIWGWRTLNWVWLAPKRLERCLRQQGFAGNTYRFLSGDIKQLSTMGRQTKYGLFFIYLFNLQFMIILCYLCMEFIGRKYRWSKRRKIINPAFHQDKLKNMLPAFYQSCSDMLSKWEKMVCTEGYSELDVWPYLVDLTRDVISRSAFGSSFEEGKRIFQLLGDQLVLRIKLIQIVYIPGWRHIKESLREMIKRREKAIKAREESNEDLLDILVESNIREMEAKNMGMSIEDVIEECKLFYFAGQETTSVLLVWTMVLLARYADWQSKAREEVLHVLGDSKPDVDGLNRLKVVTMILYEVLRLYPSATELGRSVPEEIKLGNLLLPAGTEVSVPILLIHHDKDLWGDDAREFKPERFAEGVSKATKSQVTFLPFGWGPRICIGQNFAMMEAKMAVAMILQHFWFELSPSYAHTPCSMVTLRPQHGAQIILHKLGCN